MRMRSSRPKVTKNIIFWKLKSKISGAEISSLKKKIKTKFLPPVIIILFIRVSKLKFTTEVVSSSKKHYYFNYTPAKVNLLLLSIKGVVIKKRTNNSFKSAHSREKIP